MARDKHIPGPEHLEAAEFLDALLDNDVDKFWSAISPESQAFLIGFWHGRELIGGQQVKEPTLEDPVLRQAVSMVLTQDRETMIDSRGADFLERVGVSTRKRHSEDGTRADVLFLPEHMTTVTYIAPTEVQALRIPMLLSLKAVTDGSATSSWKVDYMGWLYDREMAGEAGATSTYPRIVN